MTREELAAEISMRRDVPLEDVEEVLEEEEVIAYEEYNKKKKRKRKRMCFVCTMFIFLAGVAAIVILDKKEKIDTQAMIKAYSDTAKTYSDKMMGKINELQSKLQKMG